MIYKKHLPSCSCCILVASSVLGNDVDSCELKNGEKKKRWVSLGLVRHARTLHHSCNTYFSGLGSHLVISSCQAHSYKNWLENYSKLLARIISVEFSVSKE